MPRRPCTQRTLEGEHGNGQPMHALSRLALSSFAIGLAIYALALSLDLIGPKTMLLANPEFWIAIGFVAVLVIFVRAGVPKMVGTMLDARAAAIKAELDEARRLREEAADLLASYMAKAASAEKEAEAIVAEAK